MSDERFTIVFDGDLRGFNGNPFKADTVFGEPQTIALYDAIEQLEMFREALEKIRDDMLCDPKQVAIDALDLVAPADRA